MPDGFLVLLLALELEHKDFVAAPAADNGPFYGSAGNQLTAVIKGCLGGELDFRADVADNLFDADDIARTHPVLFSARFDNRVHVESLFWEPEHTECVGTAGVNSKFTTKLPRSGKQEEIEWQP